MQAQPPAGRWAAASAASAAAARSVQATPPTGGKAVAPAGGGKGAAAVLPGKGATTPAAGKGVAVPAPGKGVAASVGKPTSVGKPAAAFTRAPPAAGKGPQGPAHGKGAPAPAASMGKGASGDNGLKGPAAGKGAAKMSGNQAVKGAPQQAVSISSVQAMAEGMLEQWLQLPKESQDEAFDLISTTFTKLVPPEHLAKMAEKFVTVFDGTDDVQNVEESVEEGAQEEGAQEVMAEPVMVDEAVDDDNHLAETMSMLLAKTAQKNAPGMWVLEWKGLGITEEEQHDALSGLLEAEVTKAFAVDLKNLEVVLTAFAEKLEEHVQVTENAWHLPSHIFVLLFPKSATTSWGWAGSQWNWTTWWSFTERVLNAADHFRAFDILVLMLQMMQERSAVTIKSQQVWAGGRCGKIREVLTKWGEMDDDGIQETLSAYGVEI
eukprot:gnl/TRDRNA2_/TRDRNA2_173228_c1_seq1.p1 gnl/TRDRNA2_/TRDRNA2_173228_c1~~gnl/TRDRNA2_/TRDRNA2_173228_c1_seq1.p1  ORF type:complete len:452 (-),score=122.16 gnl/TRDRNA2_/TRDRNA2_173228_c1_seq1:69-1370(-)